MAADDCNITLAAVLGEQPPLGPRAGWSTISILITLGFCWPALRTKVCAAFFLPLTQAPARRIAQPAVHQSASCGYLITRQSFLVGNVVFLFDFPKPDTSVCWILKQKRNEHKRGKLQPAKNEERKCTSCFHCIQCITVSLWAIGRNFSQY